ncbi:response regulator [Clostridium oryzae]|uniref:Stage 0 sporulation protein A homolog n=1 Tax=Clostridium oryzae TaxID=1450648 RepID=A0A1V4IQ41_9CLOT|nr:response regulator [Clostridium oryzae]OPJ61905.1 chemotaxis protein CheY [Clostridium oryzae]
MKKVLIIDDAMFMREALKISLRKNGFEVVGEAENGIKGVNLYKALKPDIVTMDINMPEMDGMGALKQIINFDSKAKIIIVSALGQEVQVRRALLNGAKAFIVKPFKEDYVIETLNKVAAL